MPGRAWFGQGLIYDEVHGILQDLSILDKPDQKKSVDGPGAGQTPNAGWFNRLVQCGRSDHETKSNGSHGGLDAVPILTAFIGNFHPTPAIEMLRGERGDHGCQAKARLNVSTGCPVQPHETEPLMERHTGDEVLIWHTDGARCYRRLPLNTRVKHVKKIWVAVRQLVLEDGDVMVCYGGTQLQDGLWAHLKDTVPKTMNTNTDNAEDNMHNWVAFWAWKYRRNDIQDLFSELGAAVRVARESGVLG